MSSTHSATSTALSVQKVIVSWQHPETRAIEPVGILSRVDDGYRFSYLARAKELDGFRPLLGLPDLARSYESEELFPLFAQRAMDPKRPDFSRWVSELALDGETTPWEQIVRSGGLREGDTIQLFPMPRYVDGFWKCYFLVHGARYMLEKSVEIDGEKRGHYGVEDFERLLANLQPGTPLEIMGEEANEWTPLALLVTTEQGMPIGYVPQLLLTALHSPQASGKIRLEVERVNDASAGWHLRVLAELSGEMDAEFEFFDQETWPLATAS